MLGRLLLFMLVLIAAQSNVQAQNNPYPRPVTSSQTSAYFIHTVERGETVYSISVMYGVTTEAIYTLNPESRESIKIGEALKIPQKSQRIIFHTIQPKETLYAVSKQYNIRGEDILQENPGLSIETFTIGKTILIPVYKEQSIGADGKTVADVQEAKVNALLKMPTEKMNANPVRIALLLPFGTVDAEPGKESNSQRFVEYCEGLLLALDSLKRTGVSVDLQVYDIGYKMATLNKVLEKEDLSFAHLIIGGFTDEQINTIGLYSKARYIRYVIPFASKANDTMNNPFIFQSNPPQSYIYSKVSLAFTKKYEKSQVIFVNMGEGGDKAELIRHLQTDLGLKNVSYKNIAYSAVSISKDIRAALDPARQNVVVLSSGTSDVLAKIMAPLRQIREGSPSIKLSLFGFPEWQTYAKDYIGDLFLANTCIYSVFYANNTDDKVKDFFQLYRKWYNKSMINSYPRYALLGYDAGMYFIPMINRYGVNFETSLSKYRYQGLQMGYQFERVSNWGGFINLNVYWVEYRSDYTINREELR